MQSDPREVPRNLLALKSLVISMALVLIVAAITLVGVGISRMSGKRGFDPVSIPLAAGCQLGAVTVSGDRLVIPVSGRDDCRRLIIADIESGEVMGEIAFPPP